MPYSRVPAAIAYLVATFTAAATLGQAAPPVNVIDGPKVTADPGPLALWIGVDDISPSGGLRVAASSAQQFQPGLDFRNRTETLSIFCVAQAQSGSDDIAPLRDAVDAIMDAVAALVGGDTSLGGILSGTADAVVTAGEWQQGPTAQGMAARIPFTIDASAFITS